MGSGKAKTDCACPSKGAAAVSKCYSKDRDYGRFRGFRLMMKRKGRPPLPEGERASINLTMRMRPYLYERLRMVAELNGRSMSAEAERRLTESFERTDIEAFRPLVEDIISKAFEAPKRKRMKPAIHGI